MNFYEHFKRILAQRHITQKQLAKAMGITTVSIYSTMHRTPTLLTLQRYADGIAAASGKPCTLSDLLKGIVPPSEDTFFAVVKFGDSVMVAKNIAELKKIANTL